MSEKREARPHSRLSICVLLAGGLGAGVAAALATNAARAAAGQGWPPFVLISGLLLVGLVAAGDGLFEQAGALIARLPGGTLVLFVALMALVALVTVVLNLDTSIVFLTPTLVQVARRRGVDEAPFLYGCVFMSNSASLLLPGSNLTNLLVLSREHVSGLTFAGRIAPAWGAAVVVTVLVVAMVHRSSLRSSGVTEPSPKGLHLGLGSAGTLVAAVLVLLLRDPAPAVLSLGVAMVCAYAMSGRLRLRDVATSNDWLLFTGLFGAVVALGTIARVWPGPASLMRSSDPWSTTALAAGASTVLNNLPAAVLLSSRSPAHPLALLLGLNLGPNLAVTGSLAAILWLQVGRSAGARPSAAVYSKVGLVLAPLTIAAALGALGLFVHR